MNSKTISGLMATSNHGDTPILNSLRSKFTPQKPQSLEERLQQLSDMEMQRLLQDAKLLQASMSIVTSFGDYNHDYASLLASLYPKLDLARRELITDFLDEVAPLEHEPQRTSPSQPQQDPELQVYQKWSLPDPIEAPEPEPESEHSDFLNKLIQSESSGRADAEITIADGRRFVGKLQFGDARLQDYQNATGTTFTQDDFIKDEALQDKVASWHLQDIDKAIDALGEDATEYNRDGLRAVAHLGGVGGMRRYVRTKGEYNPSDQLGTSLQSYYDKFSNSGGA